MAKSIELVVDFETGETKTFYQPKHIKGSVALEGLSLGKEFQEKGENNIGKDDFMKLASFIAEQLYNNKFTAEECIDGIDARSLFQTLMEQLTSVFGDDSGKSSKEKIN